MNKNVASCLFSGATVGSKFKDGNPRIGVFPEIIIPETSIIGSETAKSIEIPHVGMVFSVFDEPHWKLIFI